MERLSQKQFGILGELLFRLGIHFGNPRLKESRIMTEYIVGLRHGKRSEVLTIEAEDALVAALKAKHNHPEALISYVRKSNRRGDRRNPHRQE
jgi:hypothetical protein